MRKELHKQDQKKRREDRKAMRNLLLRIGYTKNPDLVKQLPETSMRELGKCFKISANRVWQLIHKGRKQNNHIST